MIEVPLYALKRPASGAGVEKASLFYLLYSDTLPLPDTRSTASLEMLPPSSRRLLYSHIYSTRACHAFYARCTPPPALYTAPWPCIGSAEISGVHQFLRSHAPPSVLERLPTPPSYPERRNALPSVPERTYALPSIPERTHARAGGVGLFNNRLGDPRR